MIVFNRNKRWLRLSALFAYSGLDSPRIRIEHLEGRGGKSGESICPVMIQTKAKVDMIARLVNAEICGYHCENIGETLNSEDKTGLV